MSGPTPTAPAYDVIIVGARCAGATLATLLARGGASVLLLDKDALPSDYVLSTLGINPAGIDVLDEVGVGDAVRALAPAARVIRLHAEGIEFDFEFPPGRAEYCPRRERLDGLLQQAAVAAGAELRDRTQVTALLRDGDRVTGVRARAGDREHEFTARLVVGADGRHSTVARLAGAEEYLGYDGRRAGLWAFWKAPPFWKTDAAYRFDMYFTYFGGETGVIFPTDDDRLLIGSWPPVERAAAWRADLDRSLRAVLEREPVIGPLIRDAQPDGKVRGTLGERFFFRSAVGEGWVLVGDAGHHKDFVIGDGITEALLQARGLAPAIAAGTQAALTRWWRARDVAALPWYYLGKEIGRPFPPSALHLLMLSRAASDSALRVRLIEQLDRHSASFDAVRKTDVAAWTLAAAARGQPGLIAELVRTAIRIAPMYFEQHKRDRLLRAAGRS